MSCLRHAARWPALAGLALTAPLGPAAAQGLNGQAVQEVLGTHSIVDDNEGTQTVTPAGAGYSFLNNAVTTVVTPAQVTFTFNSFVSLGGGALPFYGFTLSEVGPSPVTLGGVSLVSSTVPGFDASRVSFDATHLYAGFGGLSAQPRQSVTLALSTVPEPSSGAAFAFTALGVAGLTLRARRRRAGSARALDLKERS